MSTIDVEAFLADLPDDPIATASGLASELADHLPDGQPAMVALAIAILAIRHNRSTSVRGGKEVFLLFMAQVWNATK